MVISKKVEKEKEEKERESFISKGGEVSSDKKVRANFTSIILRVPDKILNRIDLELDKKPWMNRTQWIVEAIADKLGDEE